jgi:hypothetical protein
MNMSSVFLCRRAPISHTEPAVAHGDRRGFVVLVQVEAARCLERTLELLEVVDEFDDLDQPGRLLLDRRQPLADLAEMLVELVGAHLLRRLAHLADVADRAAQVLVELVQAHFGVALRGPPRRVFRNAGLAGHQCLERLELFLGLAERLPAQQAVRFPGQPGGLGRVFVPGFGHVLDQRHGLSQFARDALALGDLPGGRCSLASAVVAGQRAVLPAGAGFGRHGIAIGHLWGRRLLCR